MSILPFDAASLKDYAAVIVCRLVVEELVFRKPLHPHDLGKFLSLAVRHLRLEPFLHATLGPFDVGVEVQVPIIYVRNLNCLSVKFNSIRWGAAI